MVTRAQGVGRGEVLGVGIKSTRRDPVVMAMSVSSPYQRHYR